MVLGFQVMSVALGFSILLTLAMCAVVVVYGLRRPVGQYLTWGEALFAGWWILGIMFLIYGVVPHQWLAFADNDLGWRKDKILFGPGDILDKALPFTLTYQVIRDIIATGIYGVGTVGQCILWAWWQRRGKAAAPKELPTSAYGRPLVKKA
jgi:hypothetical protein